MLNPNAVPTPKPAIEQSFGVIPIYKTDSEVKFLLIQHHAGHWAFPKGHADPGETELQTARRELREETGLADVLLVTSPAFEEHYKVNRKGTPREKIVRYWVGYVRNAADAGLPKVTPQEEEIRDYRWVAADEARSLITYTQNKQLFEDVLRYLAVD